MEGEKERSGGREGEREEREGREGITNSICGPSPPLSCYAEEKDAVALFHWS